MTIKGADHPGRDSIDKLHSLVLAGDEEAFEALAGALLTRLPYALRRHCHGLSHDLLAQAVEDALLEYLARPDRYDPSRGVRLYSFLYSAALRNALNLAQSEKRRRYKDMKLHVDASHQDAVVNADNLVRNRSELLRLAVSRLPDRKERKYFIAWLRGRPVTQQLLVDLGFSELPIVEQRHALKKLRERILRRLARHFQKIPPTKF